MKDIWKALSATVRLIICGIIAAVVVIAILILVIFAPDGATTFDAKNSLIEIIEVAELSTVQYTYNGVAEVKNDKETKYYVYYEGNVRAGFDMDKVEIHQEGKKIIIVMPSITIHSTEIAEGTIKYIFMDNKYNNENNSGEALNACKADLMKELQKNETFINTAKEGAKDAICALTQPFLSENEFDIQFADEHQTVNTQEVAQ